MVKIKRLSILVFVATFIVNINCYSNSIFSEFQIRVFSDDEQIKAIKVLLDQGNKKDALEGLFVIINESTNKNNSELLLQAHILLADIYRNNGDYKKSIKFLDSALKYSQNNLLESVIIYFKKGGNFQHEGLVDSAMVNYEKSILISENVKENYDLKAKVHANLSGIYYLKANYPKAIEHSKIAVNYQRILGNKEIEAGILNNLGGIYYMTGSYNDALTTFEKALSLVGFGQEELQKKTRSTSYINMAYAYSGLNNFEKAFEYQDKFFSLNDSLNQELKYKEIAEIEAKYKVEAKAKEAEIEKGKRKEAEYLIYGLAIAIVLLLLGIYVLYKIIKLRKRNYKLKIEQEQLIHQSKVEKIRGELQTKILAATLDAKLEERKKIASILHDNVSAMLSAANLHLYACKKHFLEQIPSEIDKTQSIINDASEQIRNLSHDLISAVLLKFGLSVAIQDLCEKSSNSTLVFHCECKNITRFNQNFEIKIFNIVTELVNNILKHSKSSKAIIKLEQLEGALQILVIDNGVGFENENTDLQDGIGISHIKATINTLNGFLKIASKSSGTRIFISVPILY